MEVYFLDGKCVMEVFVKRGLSVEEANMLVAKVAGAPAPPPSPVAEQKIRQVSGITFKDELFWSWTGKSPGGPVIAAFNPLECSAVFFGDPAVYARVEHALGASR